MSEKQYVITAFFIFDNSNKKYNVANKAAAISEIFKQYNL